MSEPWVEKHRPRKLKGIVGQQKAVQGLLRWAEGWKRGKPYKRAALLYGAAGTGKSVAAAALADEFSWDLIEMNASDRRTMSEIKRVAGVAASVGTLFAGAGGRRLVVLDEADNIHGAADRGGYKALKELIAETQNPLLLIANDQFAIPWDIRMTCAWINFGSLTADAIIKELHRICKEEKITADPRALRVIAETAKGDMRCAITDLQTSATGKKRLEPSDLALYRRDRELSVYDFLDRLLSAENAKEVRAALWSLDLPPEDALVWIDENIPKVVVDPASLVRVYDAISRADIFLGWAKRGQTYGLWGYASDLMGAGVALSRGRNLRRAKFVSPGVLRHYARTRVDRAVRDAVAKKIALRCHTSARIARRDIMPYLGMVFKHDKEAADAVVEELELTDAESKFLKVQG
ncbi:MAG TPA: replication factor C large subunit [Hadesarchaea archaeon]|nr:replication factor C large subunit [Hadesarchaea archaeon]